MADIDTILKRVVAPIKSTVTSTKVVKDAWKLALPSDQEYIESEVAIEKLEFGSSALGGLRAAAAPPAAGSTRSASRITVPLADSSGGTASASLDVTLYGPGDVRGLDPAQIIRRHPAPGTTTAEETVLAHIEFDRPELPWAFSPAPRPGQPIKPWLALIVVPRALASWEPATRGSPLRVLRAPLDQLPSLAGSHLWAHAQASRNIAADKPLDVRLSPAHAPVNLSRLVSPRVLRDDTTYLAAVVPTTDIGVRKALGLTGGSLDDAWTPNSDDPVRLPVYDSWEFTTGPDGGFKELALKLEGVVAPYEVGRRFIDASVPGKPLRMLEADEPGAKQVLRCALFSMTPPPPERAVAETARWPDSLTGDLRAELDRPGIIEKAAAPPTAKPGHVPDLPIVGPRIYAKLHRGVAAIEGNEDDWFVQINLDPPRRIVAGLGTRVVQKDQEALMQSAWAQLGEVEKANRAIALAQLAELLAMRLHTRIGNLDVGRLVQMTAPLSTRVSLTAGTTLSAAIATSATPSTIRLGAYRRITRPGSPVVRRADEASRRRAGTLVGSGDGLRDFTRVYRNPEGISRLSTDALKSFDATMMSRALDIAPGAVMSAVESAVSAQAQGGIATHLTRPGQWKDIDVSFDPRREIVERWGERLLRSATNPALEEVRAQRVGPLMADLALAESAAHAPIVSRLRGTAASINDRLIDRLGRGAQPARRGPTGGSPLPSFDRPGRVPTGSVGGFSSIDAGKLTRIGTTRDTQATSRALGNLAELAEKRLSSRLESAASISLGQLRQVTTKLVDTSHLLSIKPVPRRAVLAVTSQQLVKALDPKTTVRNALESRIRLSAEIALTWKAKPFIERIMAAPRFNRPMYRALDEYDRDWLVPGLGQIPGTDFVTVLSTNDEFMEAFLVGLSDEFGHELLWRGFPTDLRGTYFHRFWNPRRDELKEPIHAFRKTPLGSHVAIGGAPAGGGGNARQGRAAIVVKSELVRRFPDLIIQAIRNQGTPAQPVFEAEGRPQQTAAVLFAEYLEPDIAIVGVDLSVADLDDPDWWIVIAEHPGATRFELPNGVQASADSPDHLAADQPNAAAFARARLHRPTRVAFQATDLINTGG